MIGDTILNHNKTVGGEFTDTIMTTNTNFFHIGLLLSVIALLLFIVATYIWWNKDKKNIFTHIRNIN